MKIEFFISFCLYYIMKTFNYIYLITNNLNGKIYVGKHSTDNLNDGYMGSGKLLKLAFNKYGIENFTKKILHFAETEEELNDLEMFYIKDLDAKNNGYNLTDGGDGTLGYEPWNKGKTLSKETKQKISLSIKGKLLSDEYRQKLSESHKGKPGPLKGKHHSEETREKMSKTLKGRTSPNKGKTFSTEHRQKLSESHKGKIVWNKGKPMSEEQKRKISETLRRKKEAI